MKAYFLTCLFLSSYAVIAKGAECVDFSGHYSDDSDSKTVNFVITQKGCKSIVLNQLNKNFKRKLKLDGKKHAKSLFSDIEYKANFTSENSFELSSNRGYYALWTKNKSGVVTEEYGFYPGHGKSYYPVK